MNYLEMIEQLRNAGHDVGKYTQPPMTTKSAPAKGSRAAEPIGPLVTLSIDDVASVIDDAIAPLEQRISDLEAAVSELQGSKAAGPTVVARGATSQKQVVRIAAGRRVA